MNTSGQADLLMEYNYNKGVYDSEQNIKAAVIMALKKAVTPEYRQILNALGTREFQITDTPPLNHPTTQASVRTIVPHGAHE